MLNPDALVSLSLLINELATNSIKHAFNGTGGMLSIRAEMKGDKLSIEYRDNGKWKEPSEESTFGRELIQTLTEHLDGNVTYDVQESGTSYFFVFPKSIVLHT